MSLIIPDPRFEAPELFEPGRKPVGPVVVNDADLAGYWLFRGNAQDLVTNTMPSTVTATAAIDADGQHYNFASQSIVIAALNQHQPQFPLMMGVICKPSSTAATQLVFGNGQVATGWGGVNIFINAGGAVQILMGDGIGTASLNRRSHTTTHTVTAGKKTHITVVARSITDVDLWVDGDLKSTSSSGTATSLGYGESIKFGQYGGAAGNFYFSGKIYAGYIYDAIKPNIADIHRHPYGSGELPILIPA